jgi:P27 family predicted phage terminase small subunit
MTMTTNKPPSHLSKPAQHWWQSLNETYALDDDAAQLLLITCLEAYDRVKECQAIIKRDGLLIVGAGGQPKNHPLLTVERDSRSQMLLALKQLNLDLEPLNDMVGRPPGMH